jgi:hypothetical protein
MSEEKKMTTGGFFRALFRHALGGDGENPVHTVIKKGLQHGSEKASKVIETPGEEVKEGGHPKHEGASSPAEAEETR